MDYALDIAEELDKQFAKLVKKNKNIIEAIHKKIPEILSNPHHFKPLRAPLQNKRRVHIGGSFVLIFTIDEERKVVRLLEFAHHDDAYD